MDLMDLKGAIVIASAFGASTLIRLFCKKEDLTVPNILFTLFYFFMIGIVMANMIAKPDSIGFWLIAGAYPLMCSGGMFYVYDTAPKNRNVCTYKILLDATCLNLSFDYQSAR